MFFRQPKARSFSRPDRRVRPFLETLEDRCLLANYVWSGPQDGLWSDRTNWTPNGRPGAADTVIFNNTKQTDSIMDLPSPGKVGALTIQGHTGTIKLQQILDIDILTMSSGTIIRDPASPPQGALGHLFIRQDSKYGASTWSGGTIGEAGFVMTLIASNDHPLTFNVTGNVTFAGTQWFINGDDNKSVIVNWDSGDVVMSRPGNPGSEILLRKGTFFARSSGTISAAANQSWLFTNRGDLVLKGDQQFVRGKINKKQGGNTYKQASLSGAPGTFVAEGGVTLEGATLFVQSGIFQSDSLFTQDTTSTIVFDLGATTTSIQTAQAPELAGALTLNLLGSLDPNVTSEYTLIDNRSGSPVSGNFTDYPKVTGGFDFLLGGWSFNLSYEGGDGNDVVLTINGQPEVWGRVFTDVNGNGLRDSADTALNGVTVDLLDANLQILDTATTADGGYYSFDGLDAGTYTVAVSAPNGTFFTTQNVGSDDDFDSDVDATGHSPPFIIDATNYLYAFDAGLYEKGALAGLVWTDDDGDGLRDAGESPRSFVAVQLLDAAGNVVASTTTAADGSYSFADVVPGDYALRIGDAATLSLSPPDVGTDDTLDSDFDPTARTAPVLLKSGESLGHLDAGVFVPVTVQGKTWTDGDGDGVQGMMELALAGVPVTLFRADGVPLDDTTTNATGGFTFSGVAAGSYYLVFDAPSAGQPYYFTAPNQGGNDAFDSDVNTFGFTTTFTLTSGQSAAAFDAGLFQLGSVSGLIWDDSDADGVRDGGESGRASLTVDLLNAQGNVLNSTTTFGDGSYAFAGLIPGNYSVRFAPGAALIFAPQNAGGDDSIDSDAHPGTRLAAVAVVSATALTSVDAGVYDPLSVGGKAWVDSDGDGFQDSGEPALAGVGVALLDEMTQTTLASTTTAANGTYVFNNLPVGSYVIAFTAPSGHSFTVQGGDSDADPTTGRTAAFALATNQTAPQLNAGLYQPGDISGVVWEDSNGDGVRAVGEALVASLPVGLRDAAGNFLHMTSTASDGSYQFANLAPGSYTVELTLLPGQLVTRPNQGGDDTLDSDFNGAYATAAVSSGQPTSHVDGGIVAAVTVRGRAWSDDDADGIQDLNEVTLAGVAVSLYLADGTLVATTTTDLGGYYRFDDQLPGEYYLAFAPLAGYEFTLQNQGSDDSMDSDVDDDGLTAFFTLLSGQADALFDAGLKTS